nr:RNA-directed DNA polymerase, eukaryota, reverse transcriptase zinc-binding domain protein [Tanacetum cinerariifolium]GFC58597.1 RNA-directed DNA polymerase, eukaryota, reverse transcriptase zinc-binding domain protein [Tanacetum cinerariifolium]
MAQKEVDRHPHDAMIKANEFYLLDKYIKAVDDQEKLLFQMAKIEWLSKGVKNSRYFDKLVKGRKSMNRVISICDELGNRHEGDKVADKFVEHFSNFSSKKNSVKEMDSIEELFTSKLSNNDAI